MRATRGGLGAHSIAHRPRCACMCGPVRSEAASSLRRFKRVRRPRPGTGQRGRRPSTTSPEAESTPAPSRPPCRRASALQTALPEKATPTPACGNGETPGWLACRRTRAAAPRLMQQSGFRGRNGRQSGTKNDRPRSTPALGFTRCGSDSAERCDVAWDSQDEVGFGAAAEGPLRVRGGIPTRGQSLGQVCGNGLHLWSAACCCDRPRVGGAQRRRVGRIAPQPSAHREHHEARVLNPDRDVVHERHSGAVGVHDDGEQRDRARPGRRPGSRRWSGWRSGCPRRTRRACR